MRVRTAVLGALIAGFLAGCSAAPSGTDVGQLAEAKSSLARDTSPSKADLQAQVQDDTAFALAAYRQLAKNDGNVFFSPYSISSAIAMLSAGAHGQTSTDIATALSLSLPQERLQTAFDALGLAIAQAPGSTAPGQIPFTIHISNAMWGYTHDTFAEPFLDTLARDYGAGIYQVDFANDPQGAENRINAWVATQTDGTIPELLKGNVDALTRLVLVNAIYFQGEWAAPFPTGLTAPASFTTKTGAVTVPTMHYATQTAPEGNAINADAYVAVELPYMWSEGQSARMDIVMPKAGTLDAFEAGLTPASLAAVFASYEGGQIALSLPKFGYHASAIDLKPLLLSLGMVTPFDPDNADFSGATTTEKLHVDVVLQRATLDVDEKGTVASAATGVNSGGSSAPPPNPITVTIDHPFLFFIRDTNTNSILFAGRIVDPSQ